MTLIRMIRTQTMIVSFKDKVLSVVKKIPRGQTLSYGEVATVAGSSGAARAVGNIMKGNLDKSVPCHRVIKADGTLGGYSGLNGKKAQLLKKEGVKV
jgi:methylated-DNA-[protein]-cysteine S-methyltransferase